MFCTKYIHKILEILIHIYFWMAFKSTIGPLSVSFARVRLYKLNYTNNRLRVFLIVDSRKKHEFRRNVFKSKHYALKINQASGAQGRWRLSVFRSLPGPPTVPHHCRTRNLTFPSSAYTQPLFSIVNAPPDARIQLST